MSYITIMAIDGPTITDKIIADRKCGSTDSKSKGVVTGRHRQESKSWYNSIPATAGNSNFTQIT